MKPQERRNVIAHWGRLQSIATRDAQEACRMAVRSIRESGKDGIEKFMNHLDDRKLDAMIRYLSEWGITDARTAEALTKFYVREHDTVFERLITVAVSLIAPSPATSDEEETRS